MEPKDLGHTKPCARCSGTASVTVFNGQWSDIVMCHVCNGTGRVNEWYTPPWYSSLYIARYGVDYSRISIWKWMRLPDSDTPDWFNQLKAASIPDPYKNLDRIGKLDLVKVGWTKREHPHLRIKELTRTRFGKTVWCLDVPVYPTGPAVFLTGTTETEQMLHRRWGKHCSGCSDGSCKDPNHTWVQGEFFEHNAEMEELGLPLRT